MPHAIKKIFSPIQGILLKRGMCPACMMPLKKCKVIKNMDAQSELVRCKCSRIFVHDKQIDVYRRAGLDEV